MNLLNDLRVRLALWIGGPTVRRWMLASYAKVFEACCAEIPFPVSKRFIAMMETKPAPGSDATDERGRCISGDGYGVERQ